MIGFDFNWDAVNQKPIRCSICRKLKGNHRAHTLQCPVGLKTRVGYIMFGETVYTPKVVDKPK